MYFKSQKGIADKQFIAHGYICFELRMQPLNNCLLVFGVGMRCGGRFIGFVVVTPIANTPIGGVA